MNNNFQDWELLKLLDSFTNYDLIDQKQLSLPFQSKYIIIEMIKNMLCSHMKSIIFIKDRGLYKMTFMSDLVYIVRR